MYLDGDDSSLDAPLLWGCASPANLYDSVGWNATPTLPPSRVVKNRWVATGAGVIPIQHAPSDNFQIRSNATRLKQIRLGCLLSSSLSHKQYAAVGARNAHAATILLLSAVFRSGLLIPMVTPSSRRYLHGCTVKFYRCRIVIEVVDHPAPIAEQVECHSVRRAERAVKRLQKQLPDGIQLGL